MSFSQAEILALATKAARGAGAPAGQAARFGRAVVVHLSVGRSEDEILSALDMLPEGPVLEAPKRIDAALSQAVEGVATVRAEKSDTLFESYVSDVPFEVLTREAQNTCVYTVRCDTPKAHSARGRISMSDACVRQLKDYAAATFVPDSDASRSAGAGAGLDDND